MTDPILDPDIHIPADIIAAAQKVSAYMEANHGRYWQLMGLCDRRFATRSAKDGWSPPLLGLYSPSYDRQPHL